MWKEEEGVREGGRTFIVVAVDNEATDARSYLPIRNENEGESLSFELVDPLHDPHSRTPARPIRPTRPAANDRMIVPYGIYWHRRSVNETF